MAEEDVIIIDDEDNNKDIIIIDEDIEDAIIIKDHNIMEIDNLNEDGSEEESEEEISSLVDSDYVSDNDDELRQKKCRHLNKMEINNLFVYKNVLRYILL